MSLEVGDVLEADAVATRERMLGRDTDQTFVAAQDWPDHEIGLVEGKVECDEVEVATPQRTDRVTDPGLGDVHGTVRVACGEEADDLGERLSAGAGPVESQSQLAGDRAVGG